MDSALRRLHLKRLVSLGLTAPFPSLALASSPYYPDVHPRTLVFPRDFGAHPEYRTEWWYLTGWLGQGEGAVGFQVTFFRSRTRHPADNPSRFAPSQLLFAHAALALPGEGQLRHAEVAGRSGPAGASFSTEDTDLQLSGWRLQRQSHDRYTVAIPADTFTLTLDAKANQAPVLRGSGGYSLKGPAAQLASYYYSRPQLSVSAQIFLKNKAKATKTPEVRINKTGTAWFDHEWSSSLMMPGAVGWDWIGINLLDGGSLMAFRMRDATGATLFSEWDWRDQNGIRTEKPRNARWSSVGQWRSPRSLIAYPERLILRIGDREWTVQPLMMDQELDARASTGGFYYEGAVQLWEKGKVVGKGYLELTGYGSPVVL